MSATIVPVGQGAHGHPVYTVIDERGNGLVDERGQRIMSREDAERVAARHNGLDAREIARWLRERYVVVEECRVCDNTGDVPGNRMGDPSTPCHHCGRGVGLAQILKELEA